MGGRQEQASDSRRGSGLASRETKRRQYGGYKGIHTVTYGSTNFGSERAYAPCRWGAGLRSFQDFGRGREHLYLACSAFLLDCGIFFLVNLLLLHSTFTRVVLVTPFSIHSFQLSSSLREAGTFFFFHTHKILHTTHNPQTPPPQPNPPWFPTSRPPQR